jgi:predicted  nucleic acid-binding Zn-ribbon protein
MSQEMNQTVSQPNSQKGSTTPGQSPKKNNAWIYGTVIALLLGTNIYLFTSKSKTEQQSQQITVQNDSLTAERNSVKTEYDAALARLDELVSKNTALNSEINDKDGQISKMKSELKSIMNKRNATKAELARAKVLIEELNSKVQTYEQRIAELEGQNKALTETNTVLAKERDSTVTENVGLKGKVKLGAVLHASNIRMVPIDLRHHGKKEKETEKAKRVDLLRITFDIDENRVAESGNKDLFLRILGPDGKLLSNAAYGSGITTSADGASVNYTLQKQVALQQNQPVKNIVIDWHQDNHYQKGNYNIEIYNEGFKVGSGNVTLH